MGRRNHLRLYSPTPPSRFLTILPRCDRVHLVVRVVCTHKSGPDLAKEQPEAGKTRADDSHVKFNARPERDLNNIPCELLVIGSKHVDDNLRVGFIALVNSLIVFSRTRLITSTLKPSVVHPCKSKQIPTTCPC